MIPLPSNDLLPLTARKTPADPAQEAAAPLRRRTTDADALAAPTVPLLLRPPSQRLGARLVRATLMASGLSLLVAGLILNLFLARSQREALEADMQVQARMVADAVTGPLVFGDRRAGEESLALLHALPPVQLARVLLPDGRVFAEFRREHSSAEPVTGDERLAAIGGRLVLREPVRFQGRERGTVELVVSLAGLRWRLLVFVAITAGAALAALAASYGLARGVRRAIDRTERHLDELAYVDPVTSLPNRRAATEQLQARVQRHQRTGQPFGILLLDLDDFSTINNSLGHAAGDAVLQALSSRLAKALEPGQMACRFGGDEFIVIFDDQTGGAQAAVNLVQLALGAEVRFQGEAMRVRGSGGIARFPRDAANTDELVRAADMAMYQAKQDGKNGTAEYSAEMARVTQLRLRTETELRRALERNELTLHYQPVVELASKRIVGVEALVRWLHPERGLLAPAEFIDVAEKSGLVVELGQQVLMIALQQVVEWDARGLDGFTVAVNASARQLREGLLLGQVTRALKQHPVQPDRLVIEITEHSLVDHHASTMQALLELRQLGTRIAIDDFGTGLSSLAYLRRLPVDKLKIDRSFVRELPGNGGDAAIVRAIVSMAHALGLSVVAEGIETQAQFAFLLDAGVEAGQGYAIARPMSAAALEQWLRREPFNRVA